jgi:Protein kinase G tetratricopeptide repeat
VHCGSAMSTTVTGSPPSAQVASDRRDRLEPRERDTSRARRRFGLPRASSTPGRLWLVRAGLVLACLAWGALATLMVLQHASAAHNVAAADESLSLPAGGGPILGCEPNARAVRFGLERSYRALARLTPDEARRIELVDLANAIRPRTLT